MTEIRVNEMILMRNSLPACLQFLPDPPGRTPEEQSADTTRGHPAGEHEHGAAAAASGASGGDLGPQLRVLPDVHSAKCATAASSAATQMCSSLGCCSCEQHHSCDTPQLPVVPHLHQMCPGNACALPGSAHSTLQCHTPPCPLLLVSQPHLRSPSASSCAQLHPKTSCARLLPASSCAKCLPRIQLFTAAPHPAVAPRRPLAAAGSSCAALSRKSFSSQSPNSSVLLLNTPSRL